jgi:hypothetical protein
MDYKQFVAHLCQSEALHLLFLAELTPTSRRIGKDIPSHPLFWARVRFECLGATSREFFFITAAVLEAKGFPFRYPSRGAPRWDSIESRSDMGVVPTLDVTRREWWPKSPFRFIDKARLACD